jgi:hypothetical protein
MPWCDGCSRYWNPPTLVEGRCPNCGRQLASPAVAADEVRAPWHFKVLLVGLALYLLYRGWQGIDWVIHQVF